MHVWQFHDPKALWLLAALPAVVAMAWWWRRRRRASLQFPTAAALAASGRGWRTRLTLLPPALQLVALALAIVALARPQLASARAARSSEGIDLVIALDLSTSMQAADLAAQDRLHVAKQVLTRFLEQRVTTIACRSWSSPAGLYASAAHARLRRAQARGRRAAHAQDRGRHAIGDALGVALNRPA